MKSVRIKEKKYVRMERAYVFLERCFTFIGEAYLWEIF